MALMSDLKDTFEAMLEEDKATNEDFAQGITDAVQACLESGSTTSVYSGSCSFGAVVGTVSGSGSVDASDTASDCYDAILAACEGMADDPANDNKPLADGIQDGIDAMTAGAVVKETLSGTAVPPSVPPPTVPVSGNAEGALQTVPVPLGLGFLAAFNAMNNMSEGGNAYMATQMATTIMAYFPACIVQCSGQAACEGLSGIGAMTGNV